MSNNEKHEPNANKSKCLHARNFSAWLDLQRRRARQNETGDLRVESSPVEPDGSEMQQNTKPAAAVKVSSCRLPNASPALLVGHHCHCR